LLPEAKHIVNTVVLGFRAAKTSVFTVFFAPRVSKKRENTTYLTIFGHYGTEKKAARGNSGNNNNNNNTTSTFMIRVLPARPQPQRVSGNIPDRMPERTAENI